MYKYKALKIGLFGGSFNPPHLGHIYLSKYAIKTLKLDYLILIPTFQSVDKDKNIYADSQDRLNMLLLSIAGKKVIISSYELKLEKAIESIITVRHFKSLFPSAKLYFLFGEDHCSSLNTWKNIKELFSLTAPVIFRRTKNFSKEKILPYLTKLNILNTKFLNNPFFPISSSEFRRSRKKNLLHKDVYKYIENKKLYLK
ncbi:nicotinate (nicotinamide) nucleotide adenylyltransferase [Mycoplasma parvum]|uniref:Probable nicotinate-nucleotide adenylyltransferase n=1 Tax=Mycoplasma parvum str. Indiana TaxID=1403316 RepID=U5NG96_9MOLU|nr:nicotinate (nicotinamide) nucleotide adenylyltransferase [Mycoplasma parvum]AGX89224.1 hypothetical protein PRV_02440 [Mycoplasma parvum str. Indiana]